jgi:DNA-binding beta-propeller fold protein YncE
MKKFLAWLVLFLLAGSAPAEPGRFAYLLRFTDSKGYIDKFDTSNDKALETTPIPDDSGYNNFVVDESGNCYIAEYLGVAHYGKNIYYYNSKSKKIEHFLNLGKFFGPRYMVLTTGYLIVEICGSNDHPGKSSILFINRKTKKISELALQETNPKYRQANINDIFYNPISNRLFLSSFYVEDDGGKLKISHGDVYIVDVDRKCFEKVITVPREYKCLDGVANIGDKVYVAALVKGERGDTKDGNMGDGPSNDELLVFSASKGTLIKKIIVSKQPYKLTYDESVGKLYVQHMNDRKPRNEVEVIDVKSDKIIKQLSIPSQLMLSVIKPGKMYITVGAMFLTSSHTKPGIVVLDTKTDKEMKRLYGNYTGISEKSFVQ